MMSIELIRSIRSHDERTFFQLFLICHIFRAFPALQPAPIEAGPRNCPICGRVKGGNPTHIKKCGKEHNVDTKKLISLYKVDSKRPKPNSDQSGEPSKAADKLQINRRKRNAPGVSSHFENFTFSLQLDFYWIYIFSGNFSLLRATHLSFLPLLVSECVFRKLHLFIIQNLQD